MENPMLYLERDLWARGAEHVAGIDEAGRGPLAGPVVAACVVLRHDDAIEGCNDSKKLSAKKREQLYEQIMNRALSVSVGICRHEEIDKINILQATKKAMRQALAEATVSVDAVLIDGNQTLGVHPHEIAVIGGDGKSASVACASIVAKVTRDRLMAQYDSLYPQYGFAKHMGYGTKAHTQAILACGPCPIHRRSFLKKLYAAAPSPASARATGNVAENAAVEYLLAQGWEILARNYQTRSGEIDVIAREGQTVVFVEVKRRSTAAAGSAAQAVTPAKMKKFRQTAESYLAKNGLLETPARIDVIAIDGIGEQQELKHIKNAF